MARLRVAPFVLAALAFCSPRTVRADDPLPPVASTYLVPVGSRAVPIAATAGTVACTAEVTTGWSIESGAVRAPSQDTRIGSEQFVPRTRIGTACATPTETLRFVAVGRGVSVSDVLADPDGGIATLHGHHLHGAVVRWTAANTAGSDTCGAVTTAPDGTESCTVVIAREAPPDPLAWHVTVLPPGAPTTGAVLVYDPVGGWHPPEALDPGAVTLAVHRLVADDAGLDVSTGEGRVAFTHPEAVSSATCTEGDCEVHDGALVVRGEHSADDQLDVRVTLRPHVVFVHGNNTDTVTTLALPVQRCPIDLLSGNAFRNQDTQRAIFALRGRCAHEPTVEATVDGQPVDVERVVPAADATYVVMAVPRTSRESMRVVLGRDHTVLGSLVLSTRELTAGSARLEISDGLPVDFIPTNRGACVRPPTVATDVRLTVEPLTDAYTVGEENGCSIVRGTNSSERLAGLRFAVHATNLPEGAPDVVLAEFHEPLGRPRHAANLPITLSQTGAEAQPIVELLCGDSRGGVTHPHIGVTTSLPFRARDTCRLVLHRERLRPENGAQTLRMNVDVTSNTGAPRYGARVDRRITLRPGRDTVEVYLTGIEQAFDRVSVRIAHDERDAQYISSDDALLGTVQAEWTVIFGTDAFRFYATAAVPTGLFRVSDLAGTITVSLGVLTRLVALSREGREFPVGLEAGVIWLGIAGTSTAPSSPLGEVAFVAGAGLNVPLANSGSLTETALSLHAWFEWEISRSLRNDDHSAYGFIIGPSFTIGNAGASF